MFFYNEFGPQKPHLVAHTLHGELYFVWFNIVFWKLCFIRCCVIKQHFGPKDHFFWFEIPYFRLILHTECSSIMGFDSRKAHLVAHSLGECNLCVVQHHILETVFYEMLCH